MTQECPNCAGSLYFDPKLQMLTCRKCGSDFFPEDFMSEDELNNYVENKDSGSSDIGEELQNMLSEDFGTDPFMELDPNYEEEYVESRIFECSQCGAQVVLNMTETSTFCIYCGCPTISFSSIEKVRKPKYIVPFIVTKEEAEQAIRDRISKSKFVPKEMREVKSDCLRGIYIPYWLTDIDYDGIADLEITTMKAKKSYGSDTAYIALDTEKVCKCGSCELRRITTDASQSLPNHFSKTLEPYYTEGMKDFHPDYLLGFYSDVSNVSRKEGMEDALERAEDIFDEEICRPLKKANNKVQCVSKTSNYKFLKCESAMLPAWFFTYRYNDTPYTIAVNGQTGKITGAIPFNKKKAVIMAAGMLIGFLAFFSILIYSIVTTMSISSASSDLMILMIIPILGILLSVFGYARLKKVITRIKLSGSMFLQSYIKKRKGGM